MKSPLVPLALLWLVSVQPCGALEVRWSSGARDIRLVSTERCTLIVSCTDPDESLPSEARLLYTGVSATGDRIRVLIESSVSAEAVVCARPSTSAEEDSSRIEAALFCRTLPGDAATRSERFVLEVPAGFAGKLKYVPLVCSGRACPDPPISPLEVTVNGGSQGSYPPLVLGALGRPVGLKLSVTIHGRELIDIDTVTLSNREVRTALSLLTASTELLVAEGPLPRSASWLITVTKNDGSLATVPLELPDAAAAPPDVASDYILLRLHPGLTTNVPDGNGGPVTAFTFADSVLATELVAARVNALTPVFPWFRPEDVHGRNLIGEPVKLENLSDIYFAQLAEDADPRVAVTALRDAPGVLWTGL